VNALCKHESCAHQPGWEFVADPNWIKVDGVIKDTSTAIPHHMILDGDDMELIYAGTNTDFFWAPEVKLIKLLKAKGL
jgi:hypothetical protein